MTDMIKPSRKAFALVLAVVVCLAAACGGNSDESARDDSPAPTAPADNDDTGNSGDTGDTGDSADPGDSGGSFTGEPRGVIEVDGVTQDLALSSETDMSKCLITDSMVGVTLMVTEDGGELYVAGGDVWSASFETPGKLWEAASDNPEIDTDVTRNISENHAVIEGTWVSEDTGDTAEIRVELFCPSE